MDLKVSQKGACVCAYIPCWQKKGGSMQKIGEGKRQRWMEEGLRMFVKGEKTAK